MDVAGGGLSMAGVRVFGTALMAVVAALFTLAVLVGFSRFLTFVSDKAHSDFARDRELANDDFRNRCIDRNGTITEIQVTGSELIKLQCEGLKN